MGSQNQHLRLGILGLSEGNGHPYSWAAICNGYDPVHMKECGFSSILDYLSEQRYPEDFLDGVRVTHVWTQDPELTAQVARASKIDNCCSDPSEMLGCIDGLLLARDDAENHLGFAAPFLDAGVPLYIDKPLALNINDARVILGRARHEAQVFSCSALYYAPELLPSSNQIRALGTLERIEGLVPKSWEKYAVHVIDPILRTLGTMPDIANRVCTSESDSRTLRLTATSGLEIHLHATGSAGAPIRIRYCGSSGSLELTFADSFRAFRTALDAFCSQIRTGNPTIPRQHTMDVIQCIEWGIHPQ